VRDGSGAISHAQTNMVQRTMFRMNFIFSKKLGAFKKV
jgi:hypothetical protein